MYALRPRFTASGEGGNVGLITVAQLTRARMMLEQPNHAKETMSMTEGTSTQTQITVEPLTDDQARQMDEFLCRATALRERIHKRRKGRPLPPSWRLIRQAREARSKRL